MSKARISSAVFTKEQVYNAWAKGTTLNIGEKVYRCGKMSYGDYFIEPYDPKYPQGRGERYNSPKGSYWLERVENNPFLYRVERQIGRI